MKFNEHSKETGLFDFFESFQAMPRIIAVVQRAVNELVEAHRPDNGLVQSALEQSVLKVLLDDLSNVEDESVDSPRFPGKPFLSDDSIIGNPDKILFFTKELAQTKTDNLSAMNPFVVAKMDFQALERFDFTRFQGYIPQSDQGFAQEKKDQDPSKLNKASFSHFYQKVNERTEELEMPSMLVLTCNSVEIFRLRQTLLQLTEQATVLE